MGKSLIVKGADFSVNGIREPLPPVDITSLVASSGYFFAEKSLSSFWGYNSTSNTKRCCITPLAFSALGIDISSYFKIEVNVKTGFDYVFGTGVAIGSDTGWQGWNGSTGGQSFEWVTTNQKAEATVDNTTLSFSLNLRYDDNTTEFSASAALTDIVDSILIYP